MSMKCSYKPYYLSFNNISTNTQSCNVLPDSL
ncbi:hypothetical protein T11_3029 [Trichinella zimbabwensis]|uniref:Uncharacterized protein n=1 Tax=Trichinella zimbabwensis TaxID=268475 RepID=A0A0V1GHZ1_9BILA|nr:hypothetical protein T11_5222 [Trichinella zimbabwensis]KRY97846.1 hypothetical protein T11_974 [Trichinella zimbabwensis]KRY97850.1 hypothetical protein T11_3029 [Trichinella zimbabwensis]